MCKAQACTYIEPVHMQNYPKSLTNLIDQLKKLPGVGPKSAERIAFHILDSGSKEAENLVKTITEVKNCIKYCSRCFNLSENQLCRICSQPNRNKELICVVETPKDIQAIEKTRKFNGVYHVLLGKISPLEGISPEKLKIKELLHRINTQKPKEIILATSADVEGEATSLYLAKLIKPFETKITRIAYGIPVGSSLEFADEVTLMRAMEGRRNI